MKPIHFSMMQINTEIMVGWVREEEVDRVDNVNGALMILSHSFIFVILMVR